MGMGPESGVRPERSQSHNFGAAGTSGSGWPAQQADEPGAWRASLGRGDLMSVVAESARLHERPQSRTAGAVSFAGYGQHENAWPPDTAAGAWPSGAGEGDLMSVVASAGRSERWQPHAASAAPSAGQGLPWTEGPHPTASGSSSIEPWAPAPVAANAWPSNSGAGDLMSVVAAGAHRSVGQQFAQSGTASSMWPGPVEGAAPSSMPFNAPGRSSTSSSRKLPPPERFSEEEFDRLVSLVKDGKNSAQKALQIMERTDVPGSTARDWLSKVGVESSRAPRRSPLSAAKIEEASAFHESYLRNPENTKLGVVKATFDAVNDGSFGYGAFRHYFHVDGLTEHGKKMLKLARKAESDAGANASGSDEG
jgi:hypothetical protein